MVFLRGSIYGLRIGGRTFGGFGVKDQSDVSSVSNISEGSFTEEGTGAGKAIFEGGFKFAASEARKNFNITDSVYRGEIGGNWVVIGDQAIERSLEIY